MVSVTPSTSVRAGGNVVGGIHDIYGGGGRRNHESGRAGSCAGIARAAGGGGWGGVTPRGGGRKSCAKGQGQKIDDGPLAAKTGFLLSGGEYGYAKMERVSR